MNTAPLISVILPVYNCEKYILESINSILNQNYSNFELLIIDDCSTDDTVKIIQSIPDSRIQLIKKEKNTGYVISLNYGLTIAKGDYIARMDADDISMPDRFEKQIAFLENNNDIVMCGSAFKIIGTDTIITVPEVHDEIIIGMLEECKIAHPTVMIRASFLKEHNLEYNLKMMPSEDYDLWIRILQIGKIHNLQDCLLNYRIHIEQISNVKNQLQQDNALEIKLNHLQNIYPLITSEEKEVYKKMIINAQVKFNDIYIFLKLKNKILNYKNNIHVNKTLLKEFFERIEKKYVNKYFKYGNNYSLNTIKEYLKISNLISRKLTLKEFIKLSLKSLIFYKRK